MWNRCAAFIGVPLLAALALSTPVRAQERIPGPAASALVSAVTTLRSGTPLRVATQGRYTVGRLHRAGTDSIVLVQDGAEWGIPLSAVDSLWVQQSGTRRGAAAGGVLGALAGMAVMLVFVSGMCDAVDGCGSDYPPAMLLGAAVGGGGGALVGAGLGSLSRRWERRFP